MFGKLRDKLKSWISKSKDKIEDNAPKKEIKEEISEINVEDDKKILKELSKQGSEKNLPIEKEDSMEILSKKSPKEVKEILEEKKEDSGEDVVERIKEVKKEEINKTTKIKPERGNKGFLSKLRSGFKYEITREEFDEIFDDLEILLLENNVALEVIDDLRKKLSSKLIGLEIKKEQLKDKIKDELKSGLDEILIEPKNLLEIIKSKKEKPFVILFFGINGTGKTTSIAKLAYLLKNEGFSVVLAAGDTFRAASIEQISHHANKLGVPLIKHDYKSDPASVGFDAIKYAKKNGIDIVLIDSAGRMHTQSNLLSEMEKIVRVTNPDLKIFVAESIAGNDAIEQAKAFEDSIGIDGSILSKADIDDKGGTILSISSVTKKPIFYLGIGQNYGDLILFDKETFLDKLF